MNRTPTLVVSLALLASLASGQTGGQRVARGTALMAPHERVLAGGSAASLAAPAAGTRAARHDAAPRELRPADGTLALHDHALPSHTRDAVADRPRTVARVYTQPHASAPALLERIAHTRRVLRLDAAPPAGAGPALVQRSNVQRVRQPAAPLLSGRNAGPTLLSPAAPAAGRWWAYMFDNFEGAFPNYWILQGAPTWGITSYRASTGSRSVWCAASQYAAPGPYLNNMNGWIIDGPFDLRNTTSLELYFDYWVDSEPVADAVFVGASLDGLNFTGNAYSGFSAGWVRDAKITLNQFAGAHAVYVGVQFSSDAAIVAEGAYVDNIELDGYIASASTVDMAVRNARVLDAVDEIFDFDVHNYGPGTAAANSYALDVFVDGVLDSSARNTTALAPGATVKWEWQLAFIYPPGPHTIRVELRPDGGDIAPADNALSFVMNVVAPQPVDLSPRNVVIVNPSAGAFDFDVHNAGPGIARAGSYRIRVTVDGLFDSEVRNSLALGPGETVAWQWQLAYYYSSGAHSVRVEVLSDAPDPNPGNNAITFVLSVPQPVIITDLQLRRPKLTDPQNDVFTFQVRNFGPRSCRPGDYEVRVYVDGLLDSTALNGNDLYVGWIADWTWQLNYLYPPGLHVVTIEVWPMGEDLRPIDNVTSLHLLKPGQNLLAVPPATVTTVVASAISMPVQAVNGAPPYTWRISSGALPPGVYLSGNGVLAGVPSSPGAFNSTIEARDAAGLTAFAPMTIVVLTSPAALPLSVLVQVLPPAFVNVTYAVQLSAVGGTAPYVWSAISGFAPGTTLSSAGVLAGVPLLAGTFAPRAEVTDAASSTATATLALPVLHRSQYLNADIRKCTIKIPWALHEQGAPASDTLSFRALCDVPQDFVLDGYARLVVWIGDYSVSFSTPRRAVWKRSATFKTSDTGGMKASANVVWSGSTLRVTVTLKRADLAAALARSGVTKNGPPTAIVPVRIALNGTDTGLRSLLLNYKLSGSNGRLKKQ